MSSGSMQASVGPNALVADLVDALRTAEVSYCHWKSNPAIERTLSGENDLDLLIARGDAAAFTSTLESLGFRPGMGASEISEIENYYGWDSRSERLVHVHAHYRLAMGHDRSKNYSPPIEDALLASVQSHDSGIPIPAPAFEFVILTIRLVLKYATIDEIGWWALRGRRAGPKESELVELEVLRAQADHLEIEHVLATSFPTINAELFGRCVKIADGSGSVLERVSTSKALHKAMAEWAERPPLLDMAVRIAGRVTWLVKKKTSGSPRARLASGGQLIALVGGDGAGKSTAVEGLVDWLGDELDVRTVHLGRPTWSKLTWVVRAIFKATAVAASTLGISSAAATIERWRLPVWFTCTARDRAHLYRSASQMAAKGTVVVSDRFPLSVIEHMDAPFIRNLSEDERPSNRIIDWMIKVEERYHQSMTPPSTVLVLSVDPEVAVARNTVDPPEYVRRRNQQLQGINWAAVPAHVIDAGGDVEAVRQQVRRVVWDALG